MKTVVRQMMYEWKVMVYLGRMDIMEYDIRRAAINEMFERWGLPMPRPPGWVALRKRMKAKYPDIVVPATIRDRCYSGRSIKKTRQGESSSGEEE